jgi:hypothetical protein
LNKVDNRSTTFPIFNDKLKLTHTFTFGNISNYG